VLEDVGDCVGRVGLDLADQAQEPEHVGDKARLARNPSKQSYQWNRPALL
jgi:hypothetical protein